MLLLQQERKGTHSQFVIGPIVKRLLTPSTDPRGQFVDSNQVQMSSKAILKIRTSFFMQLENRAARVTQQQN